MVLSSPPETLRRQVWMLVISRVDLAVNVMTKARVRPVSLSNVSFYFINITPLYNSCNLLQYFQYFRRDTFTLKAHNLYPAIQQNGQHYSIQPCPGEEATLARGSLRRDRGNYQCLWSSGSTTTPVRHLEYLRDGSYR
jgi:hypothetical protein